VRGGAARGTNCRALPSGSPVFTVRLVAHAPCPARPVRFAWVAVIVCPLLVAAQADARFASRPRRCIETSDVVGASECSRFGDGWSAERAWGVFGGAGLWISSVQPRGEAFEKSLPHTSYRAADFLRGPVRSYGFDLRVAAFLSRALYVGGTFGLSGGHADARGFATENHAVAPLDGMNFTHARVGPLLGLRAHLGKTSVRVEVLGAVQAMQLKYRETYHDGRSRERAMGGVSIAVEPRAAVDWWLTPFTSLSLWGGLDVIRPGNSSIGFAIASHVRAFDGAF
jgi:hypothetical protein